MGSSRVIFREELWPLVGVSLRGELSDEDYQYLLARFETLQQRARRSDVRFGSLIDASRATKAPSLRQRQMLSAWAKDHEADIRRYAVASSIVVASPPLRIVINGILWMTQSAPPKLHGTREQAVEWLLAELAQAGIAVPAHLPRQALLLQLLSDS